MDNVVHRPAYRYAMDLQASLLSLDEVVQATRLGTDPSETEAAAAASTLVEQVKAVWEAQAALVEFAPSAAGFIPSWLAPSSAAAAAGLLQARLASAGPWSAVARHMKETNNGLRLLADLVDEWDRASERAAEPVVYDAPDTGPAAGIADPIRVWFPVVHMRTGRGLLFELVLGPAGAGGGAADDTGFPNLAPEFRRAVRTGAEAGLELSRRLGLPVERTALWESVVLTDIVGAPRGFAVKDRSAGAPTAVAVVRHLLRLPAVGGVVTGEITERGIIRGISDDHRAAKAAAAEAAGTTLVAFGSDTALAEACQRLWPEQWRPTVKNAAAEGLRDRGHDVSVIEAVGTNLSANGTEFALIPTHTSDDVFKRMEAGQREIVVGGPNASGRTTAARQAALAWRDRYGTPVVELSVKDGRLPDETELRRDLELTRLAADIPAGENAVLILENLLPYQNSVDLDAVLTGATDGSPTTLIAVCFYPRRVVERWRTDQVATSPGLSRADEVLRFAEEFGAANRMPALSPERRGLLCKYADGDLWLLIHLLLAEDPLPQPDPQRRRALALAATTGGADEDDAQPDATSSRRVVAFDAYARRVQAAVPPDDLAELRAVAASSLLRVAIPDTMLSSSAHLSLLRVGGRTDRLRRWYIPRSATCRALLTRLGGNAPGTVTETGWRRTVREQEEVLFSFLQRHLVGYDPVAVGYTTAVLSAAAAVAQRVHRSLLPLVTEALLRHLGAATPPVMIARALLAGGTQHDHDNRVKLFTLLLKALNTTGWTKLTAREASTCLTAVRSSRDLAYEVGAGPENLLRLYRDVRNAIDPGIRPALARSSPPQAVLLIHEVGQFYESETSRNIVDLAVLATSRCDPSLVDHYAAAISLVEAAAKYGVRSRSETLDAFVAAPGIRGLIDHGVHSDAGLALARAALSCLVDRRTDTSDNYHQQVVREVRSALPAPSPRRVVIGLEQFRRVDTRVARMVVAETSLAAWLRSIITDPDGRRASPWEIAELIRKLDAIDANTVGSLLYRPDGDEADAATVEALARLIVKMGDIKSVGHVLSAIAAHDALWGPGGRNNAGTQLCSLLLPFVDEALDDDIRGSVVYKTMEALINAEIATKDLWSFLDRSADIVASEAEDNDKDYAPRLALLLGTHDTAGPEFLTLLRERLDDNLLLQRMTHSQSIEARVAYIHLATALGCMRNDAFVERFLEDEWLTASLADLRTGRVLSVLKAVDAINLALKDADYEVQVSELLVRAEPAGRHPSADEPNPRIWAERLRRLNQPGQLAQALDLLRGMSRPLAEKCLTELDALLRPGSSVKATRRAERPRAAVPAQRAAAPAAGRPVPAAGRSVPAAGPPTPADLARIVSRKRENDLELPGLLRLVQSAFVPTAEAIDLIRAVRHIDFERGRRLGEMFADGSGWWPRARAIVEIENPVLLGDLLRSTTEAYAYIDERLVEKVWRSWQVQVSHLRSPNVTQSLLRGFAAYRDVDVVRTWSSRLRMDRIGRRISRGFAHDLKRVPMLIRALDVWGADGAARELAEYVPDTATLDVDPDSAAALLTALDTVAPHLARKHADLAVPGVAAQAARTFLVKPHEHWNGLGWLIRTVRRLGSQLDVDAAMRAALDRIHQPHLHAWVAGCLGLGIDDGVFVETDPKTVEKWPAPARAARLVVRSDSGRLDDGEAAELTYILDRVGPTWRLELLRLARVDPVLRRLIAGTDLAYLEDEARYALSIGQPYGAEILTLLDFDYST